MGALKFNSEWLIWFPYSGSLPFSRKHPLSTYISSMLVIFSGGMLANFFLGEPILGVMKNNQQLAVYSAVW